MPKIYRDYSRQVVGVYIFNFISLIPFDGMQRKLKERHRIDLETQQMTSYEYYYGVHIMYIQSFHNLRKFP